MISEDKIRKQYSDNENNFADSIKEIKKTFDIIAKLFFQKTRFTVKVDTPRLKTIDSCIKKIKKKSLACDSLFVKIDDRLVVVLNDFIGFRILCNTQDDVYKIEELVNDYKKRLFVIQKQDFINEPKESGYRALHLDLEYELFWDDDRVRVPIELQIKTHLQHAWSELTHDESYKPSDELLQNEWEKKYSKHMAEFLDKLDSMAKTIRDQRVKYVLPPKRLDSEILINQYTLSYKISELRQKEQLTQQEMLICLSRLKELTFESLQEVNDLLLDKMIEQKMKIFKEKLKDNSNVTAFELLFYGSLLKKNLDTQFEKEMSHDLGFVEEKCEDCGKLLTKEEYEFINSNTDGSDYFCEEHRNTHYGKECMKCGIHTKGELCINCESLLDKF